jgi:hypothetical protein
MVNRPPYKELIWVQFPMVLLWRILTMSYYTAKRELYLTKDGKATADAKEAETLLVAAGGQMPQDEADTLGLDAVDKAADAKEKKTGKADAAGG